MEKSIFIHNKINHNLSYHNPIHKSILIIYRASELLFYQSSYGLPKVACVFSHRQQTSSVAG